jgi:hypothetical protein
MKEKIRMKKLIAIATILSLVLLALVILAPQHFQEISVAAPQPLYAMKTLTNGWFYIPTIPAIPTRLKIEMVFNDSHLVGDQYGNVSKYSTTTWPDGSVDGKDITFVAGAFGTMPGNSRWNYMADVLGNQKVDGRDIIAVVHNFDQKGTYQTWPVSGVNVTFNTGPTITPDSSGYVTISSGATSFIVYQNGIPIGAMVTFWPLTGTANLPFSVLTYAYQSFRALNYLNAERTDHIPLNRR